MTYSRLLESVLLPTYDRVRGRQYVDRRTFLERSQWWSAERLREFQWSELKKLLAHAFASVPYLADKYRKAGIALADLRSWDDFRRLPPLTRAEINAHGPELCSTAYKGKLLPHATGGSTGVPTRFFRTYESYDWRQAAKDRAYSWAGWRPRRASHTPVGCASRTGSAATGVEDTRVRSRSASADRQYVLSERRALERRVLACAEISPCAHRRLRLEPGVVRCVPSTYEADDSRRHVRDRRCRAALRRARVNASRADSACRSSNTYGSREFMSIAGECECRDGLHIHAENLVVETRDPDADTPSEILVTDLHNYGMPFVRYETGDLGTMTDMPCRCGRGLPRLKAIEGRVLDAMRTADGRTVPGEFFPHSAEGDPRGRRNSASSKSASIASSSRRS